MDKKWHKALAATFSAVAVLQLFMVWQLTNEVNSLEASALTARVNRAEQKALDHARTYRNRGSTNRAMQYMRVLPTR